VTDLTSGIRDRRQHALAEKTLLVAVTQLQRFARAGRGARRRHRAPDRAVGGQHIGLDRRIAARIENLACADIDDFRHGNSWMS
jgi:hypothetical protein